MQCSHGVAGPEAGRVGAHALLEVVVLLRVPQHAAGDMESVLRRRTDAQMRIIISCAHEVAQDEERQRQAECGARHVGDAARKRRQLFRLGTPRTERE